MMPFALSIVHTTMFALSKSALPAFVKVMPHDYKRVLAEMAAAADAEPLSATG